MLFEATELTSEELALQAQVRSFLEAELPRGTFHPGLGMAAPRDRGFSRKLADHGLNVTYAYGSIVKGEERALIILGVSDVAEAEKVV